MSEKQARAPWVRAVVEGAVIVGSILLAYGIQAWWDESRDRAEERRALGAPASESRDAQSLLERQSLLADSIVAAVETIHLWTGRAASSRHTDSLRALVLVGLVLSTPTELGEKGQHAGGSLIAALAVLFLRDRTNAV